MMPLFSVTYEIVTPESAEHGDAEETGFIAEGLRLREAIDEFEDSRTRACSCTGTEDTGRWISTSYDEFETGHTETRSIHPYPGITASSYRRLCRLLGAIS